MTTSETITKYQPLLYSIALKMTGTVQDAEDLVNDTFLNWLKKDHKKVKNTKAYLTQSIKNACLNHVNDLTRKKEEIFDQFKHNSFVEKIEHEFTELDLKHEMNHAISVVVKKLEPVERAIFMLREVFNVEYAELSTMVGKKDENCRKILSRAKKKLSSDDHSVIKTQNFVFPDLLKDFEKACKIGEFYDFVDVLKEDFSESVQKVKKSL